MSHGFDQLSAEMGNVSRGISELSSVFEWGFSELLTEVGHLNDSLNKLVKIAKTPAQTWAFEQFEMARDAFRKGLFKEALEFLNHAINGFGDHTGNKIEYRFHYLLGVIRLGSFKNVSLSIVDPAKAEKAFLNSAKYAQHDFPKEAARSFLSASWAAYCQGKNYEAKQHVLNSISFHHNLPESHFQLAKILMHLNNPSEAIKPLEKAIMIDKGYIVKAYDDDDFKPHKKYLDELAIDLHKKLKQNITGVISDLENEKNTFINLEINGFVFGEFIDIDSLKKINNDTGKIKDNIKDGTYYKLLDLKQESEHLKNKIDKLKTDSFNSARQYLNAKISELKKICDKEFGIEKLLDNGVLQIFGWLYFLFAIGKSASLADSFLGFIFYFILINFGIPGAIIGALFLIEYLLTYKDKAESRRKIANYEEVKKNIGSYI